MRVAAWMIIALGLSACAGPRSAPPAAASMTPIDGWRSNTATGPGLSDHWWRAFKDPALDKLVEASLSNNVDIAIAAGRVEEARAQFRLAQAQRMPNLAGVDKGGRQRDVDPFGRPRQQWLNDAELSITADLDLFGRLSTASEAEKAAFLASEAGRANVKLATTVSVASGYFALAASRARLAVLRDTLAARTESLRLARRRAEAGYASALDLRQAEAEYQATAQLIPSTEQEISRQENGLSLLLGDGPHEIAPGIPLAALSVPVVPAGLPSALLRQRPDILQAEQQLVAADRTLDSARAAFMPNIQLNGSVGQVAAQLLTNPMHVFFIGGSILAPIFDGGRLQAQQERAVARRDQAAFAYRKVALNAFREVDDAITAGRKTAEQETVLIAQRDALSHALKLAEGRYRAGYSPYLEQLDAQRSLLAVDLALVQARSDRLSSSLNLVHALGGGWDGRLGETVGISERR